MKLTKNEQKIILWWANKWAHEITEEIGEGFDWFSEFNDKVMVNLWDKEGQLVVTAYSIDDNMEVNYSDFLQLGSLGETALFNKTILNNDTDGDVYLVTLTPEQMVYYVRASSEEDARSQALDHIFETCNHTTMIVQAPCHAFRIGTTK